MEAGCARAFISPVVVRCDWTTQALPLKFKLLPKIGSEECLLKETLTNFRINSFELNPFD
jgi:hypothetical protein